MLNNFFCRSLLESSSVFWKSGENFNLKELTNPMLAGDNFMENFTAEVLKLLQNSQESICGRVSFLIKLQAASDLFRLFSWQFLVYLISTEKWSEKREILCWSSIFFFFFCSSINLFDVKDFKRNFKDGNLIRKCV